VAADEDPMLDDAEIGDLLAMSKLADSAGRAPSDTSWSPTWDLNRGAAEGWRWKAAKVATRFDFTTDGQDFKRSQAYQACLEMAKRYSRKIHGTITVAGALARSDD
jgi:hypothetical protein